MNKLYEVWIEGMNGPYIKTLTFRRAKKEAVKLSQMSKFDGKTIEIKYPIIKGAQNASINL
jgi:hypothetical protein